MQLQNKFQMVRTLTGYILKERISFCRRKNDSINADVSKELWITLALKVTQRLIPAIRVMLLMDVIHPLLNITYGPSKSIFRKNICQLLSENLC